MKLFHHPHFKTLFLLVFSATFAHAGFLKIGDIKGEATDSAHKEWIDALSVDWRITEKVGDSDTRNGGLVVGDFKFTKRIDQASPKLQEAVLNGDIIPLVEYELTLPGDNQSTYMRIELKQVAMTNYSMSGVTKDPITGLEVRPVEEFSMKFQEIKVTYTPFKEDGSPGTPIEYTWKVEEGEA